MSRDHSSLPKLATYGAYLFMGALIFWPLADLFTSVWPLQPGSLGWRYGVLGLMAAYLHTPLMGLVLAMIFAYTFHHPRALRVLSGLGAFGAAVLTLVMIRFLLDVLELRAETPAERLPSFQAGAAISELKHLTSFIALVLLSLGGWKTASNMASGETSRA